MTKIVKYGTGHAIPVPRTILELMGWERGTLITFKICDNYLKVSNLKE